MDESLKLYNVPKLNHEESRHLNRSITGTESQIQKPATKKNLGPDGFTVEFYQTVKKKKKKFT